MEETPTTSQKASPTKKAPYGPGVLMVFGLALVAVAVWCGYDLHAKEEWVKEGRTGTILFNWAGLIIAAIAAVYTFILAAVRAKKPTGEPPQG